MATVHLAHAVGGNLMLGFVSAVAFATILAVGTGLTLAGASAVSHDLYASVLCQGRSQAQREVQISKAVTLALGLLAVGLGGLDNAGWAYVRCGLDRHRRVHP